VIRIAWAVATRPSLWSTAVRQLIVLGGRPSRPYLAFRSLTQYGRPDHPPVAADVVSYLSWLRTWNRLP
jgi:hypothetical protein